MMSAVSARCNLTERALRVDILEMTAACVRRLFGSASHDDMQLVLTWTTVSGKCGHNFHMVRELNPLEEFSC